MTQDERPTLRSIRTALAAILATRPAYSEILNYFGDLFLLQETAMPASRPPEPKSGRPGSASRFEAGDSLVDPWELTVDEASAAGLLERICGLSVRAGDAPPAAARAIRAALGAGCLPLSRLARCLLSKRWEEIQAVALRLGIDAEGMCFFIYHGIVPSLANHARVLAAGIAGTTALERGTCPVCGSPPAIAALNSLGERHMSCSLCRYQWRAPRLFCPSCGTGEGRELEYFYTEEEKEYRVTICSRCRRYLKTVDTRQMERPCYAPLEDVASWHLDMMARQAGFLSMSPQFDRTPFSPLQGMPDGREWNDETYDLPHRFRSG